MSDFQPGLPKYKCTRCGFEWIPRKLNPKFCPNCHYQGWNPYQGRFNNLTGTERSALLWLSKTKQIPLDKIYKQHGSPDFVLSNNESYEVKRLVGNAVYIGRKQIGFIKESYPDCKLLVFKDAEANPLAVIPFNDISDNSNNTTFGKWGEFYIFISI